MLHLDYMAFWGLCGQEFGIQDKWRLSQEQRPPQYQKLGDAAIREDFFAKEFV